MNFIDLKTQYQKIENNIKARIHAILDHGKYINGPEVSEVEEKLADFCGAKHCVALGSGTDALLLGLMAIDLDIDDEVIVPAFSFFATAEVVSLLRGKPVFCDIDPETYCIDPTQIESLITKKTKAIIPVSLYGQCADMDAINAIAEKYGLSVLEDAAQSFGANYKGKGSCSLSKMAATSFYPAKPLGAYGDAGAFFTNDESLAQKVRILKEHGSSKQYYHTLIGLNGRCDSIQAAILLEKLAIFDEEILARQKAAAYYSKKLDGVVKRQIVPGEQTSVFAQYTIEIERRDSFREFMQTKGIPTAVHYPASMNKQPIYQELGFSEKSFSNSDAAAEKVVSLPMHPYLTEVDQDKVISSIKEFLKA